MASKSITKNYLKKIYYQIPLDKVQIELNDDHKRTIIAGILGKFQMQVLPQCGHAVHEDVPDKVAEVVATFLLRNRLTSANEKLN